MGQLVLAPPLCIDALLVLVHAVVFKIIVKKRKKWYHYMYGAFHQTMPGLTTDEDSNSSEDEFSELKGEELVESLQRRLEHELGLVEGTTAYEKVAASSRLT